MTEENAGAGVPEAELDELHPGWCECGHPLPEGQLLGWCPWCRDAAIGPPDDHECTKNAHRRSNFAG